MTKILDDILHTIGHTPVVRINRLAPANVELFVKLESFNPMGSVKDRMALNCIETAERDGSLKPGQTVIEATSGNTGIGLAMVCAAKGYPLVLVMSENFSIERRKILRFLGAKVVITPAALKGSGMLAKAIELAEQHGWFLVRQFENEANADAHSRTTALEILQTFEQKPLDYFVTGYGTGGTLKGIGRVLREKSPSTRIVVCEPDNAPILGSGIPQKRKPDGSADGSHPNFRPHLMQGWSPDFIPHLTEDAINMKLVDQVVAINGRDALDMAQELARKEGIFCGTSGGATFSGALKVAKNAAAGSRILCMLPDTGERYLSTPLFENISADMNPEEERISASTPGYRFKTDPEPDRGKPAEPVKAVEAPLPIHPQARELVDGFLDDPEHPVVMFALEWCEFCWAVRKLFKAIGLDYRSVDLDSVTYQEDDLGGKIRKVLEQYTGAVTIPQVFIAGKHFGGASDVFDHFRDGRLQQVLQEQGIAFTHDPGLVADTLLPNWLHKS